LFSIIVHIHPHKNFITYTYNLALTSVEGIARASRVFFGFDTGLKKYHIKKSDIILNVDPSVKEIRPFVTAAIVKNVTNN